MRAYRCLSRFPASPIFDNFGSLGVSMFFVSYVPDFANKGRGANSARCRCIISQLTYTLGGSIFK